MNTQLWIPYFGVKLVFDNTFLHQDVQLQTATQLKLNNIISMDEILSKDDKQLSTRKRLRLLGITEIDTEKMKVDLEQSAEGMDNQMPLSSMTSSDSQLEKRKRKSDLNNRSSNTQGNKPTGE